MADFQPPSLLAPNQPGVQVQQYDWNAMLTFAWEVAGYAVAFSQGVTNGDAIPQFQALACAPAGGMVITLGGSSSHPQFALIAGVLSAAKAAQTFTVPNNSSGQTRIDIVCVQMQPTQGSTVSRAIEGDGNQNIPYNYAGIAFQYVQGTPGGGQPSAPSGWETFAVITVPNGLGSIGSGNIAVVFPVMNPTGPTGPQGPPGHGPTTLTSNVTIPTVGNTVAMPVADAVGFPAGTPGLVISGTKAMWFSVLSVAGSTCTVMNVGAVDGYSNSGTLNSPGLVTFGVPPPFTFMTQQIALPNIGATVGVQVNSVDEWNVGMYGVVFGPNNSPQAFIFVVQTISANTLTVECIAKILGSFGNNISPGALVFPCPPPVVLYQDGAQVPGAQLVQTGRATDPGNGGSVTVTFAVPYTSSSTYRITGLTPCTSGPHGFAPYVSGKTASGFTITIPSDTTGHGDIEWGVVGALPT
jgi:hypothetical protein